VIDQQTLKKYLRYEPDSGLFIRRTKAGRCDIGDIAGSKSGSGYIYIRVEDTRHSAHRLAFLYVNGEFPPEQVDHVNHVTDDNRWCNLRLVSNLENARNQSMHSHNTSGTTGVSWYASGEKWSAEIMVNGKAIFLGRRTDKQEAIKLRKDAEVKYGFHENHGLAECI